MIEDRVVALMTLLLNTFVSISLRVLRQHDLQHEVRDVNVFSIPPQCLGTGTLKFYVRVQIPFVEV